MCQLAKKKEPQVVISHNTFDGGPSLEAIREAIAVLGKLVDKLSTVLLQVNNG